jgi:quinol monooxygenase YgiN
LVLPLIDENKPKCYLCHEIFENMVDLKKHQESRHKEFFEKYEKYDTEN